MLSRLTLLSITSLQVIAHEVDTILLHTNPICDTDCLVQNYTHDVLRPIIDEANEHVRHFMDVFYSNKGIDFNDLPSIFRDKSVIDSIPAYFRNSESPIICYKYKNPIWNISFNYNEIVSDGNIVSSTPKSCECKESKLDPRL